MQLSWPGHSTTLPPTALQYHSGCFHRPFVARLQPRKQPSHHRPVPHQHRCLQIRAAAADAYAQSAGRGDDESSDDVSGGKQAALPPAPAQKGLWQKIKGFFMGDKLDKQRLAALGLGAVASYGFVSNVTYGTGLAVSWIAFVKQFGKGPLMPGQWKAFLGFYAGFWTVQNFLRPLRFSLALAMAPAFDRGILEIQKITKFKRRDAFGVYLFILGSVTSTLIFGSIFIFAGPLAFARHP